MIGSIGPNLGVFGLLKPPSGASPAGSTSPPPAGVGSQGLEA